MPARSKESPRVGQSKLGEDATQATGGDTSSHRRRGDREKQLDTSFISKSAQAQYDPAQDSSVIAQVDGSQVRAYMEIGSSSDEEEASEGKKSRSLDQLPSSIRKKGLEDTSELESAE